MSDAVKTEQLALPLAVQAQYRLSQRGVYDAQTLKAEDPEKYELILKYLEKSAFSKRLIADACDCAFETVVAVYLQHNADIRAGKRGTVRQLDIAIAYGMEGLIEQAKAGKLTSIDLGILMDKRELLNGGVTERVGHVLELDPDVEAFRQYAPAIEVPSLVLGMGSEGGNFLQEGGVGGLADGIGDLGEEGTLIELSGEAIEPKVAARDGASDDGEAQSVDDQ